MNRGLAFLDIVIFCIDLKKNSSKNLESNSARTKPSLLVLLVLWCLNVTWFNNVTESKKKKRKKNRKKSQDFHRVSQKLSKTKKVCMRKMKKEKTREKKRIFQKKRSIEIHSYTARLQLMVKKNTYKHYIKKVEFQTNS